MENLILFDNEKRDNLLPLTFSKPISELRIGIHTIREKWEKALDGTTSHITQEYLSQKFPITISDVNLIINGSVLPSPQLAKLVKQLEINEALLDNGDLIAARLTKDQFDHLINNEEIDELSGYEVENTPFLEIKHIWDIFQKNGEAIQEDFDLLTKERKSEAISFTNKVLGEENIFIEDGAQIECATLNATTGPIYIGKNAVVMEGSNIRGPFALCHDAVLKMGARIYGPTTIGPYSKVGGEVNNSVIQGYSNKAHDGFLGNSVIGEWCNLGADTNTSNLKNNYTQVKLWSYPQQRFDKTGLQFCGLIMGDHSKCGINTMFNTGTVVGFSANVFGDGYPRNYLPSFSWGGAGGLSTYQVEKALETAGIVMARRDIESDQHTKEIFEHLFELTAPYRTWEKNV